MFNPVNLVWWLSIIAESALLATLFRRGLFRVYRFFTAYIAADVCVSLAMMWLTPDWQSKAYARLWMISEPLLIVLQVAFAIELYALISNHYRNFERVRPRLFWSCMLAALGISLLVLMVDMPAHWTSRVFQGIILAKRVATFALAAFVVVVTIFLRIFRVPMRLNVTRHRRIAAVYFLVNASLVFAANLAPGVTKPVNLALMSLTAGCFVAWAMLLKPEGEAVESPAAPTRAEIEAHLHRGEELGRRIGSLRP